MRHFGLIGYPLAHSFSPEYFRNKFNLLRIESTDYKSFEIIDLNKLSTLIHDQKLEGFNVTIPHKENVIPYLDELTKDAEAIGSVNCVKVIGGKLVGYNTDVIGFANSLREFIGENRISSALVLGSGGGSKAVQFALNQVNIPFNVVSRSGELTYESLSSSMIRSTALIVNTTPVGMFPSIDESPDIPYEAITSKHFAFDLIYNPTETSFLRKCRLLGAKTTNGLKMLEIQADKSWEIWNE